MPLTAQCDIYGAILDAGVNRLVRNVFRQRPSLVNLGTSGVVQRPSLLCREIDAHRVVRRRENPLLRLVDGLPVALTDHTMEYALQVTALEVDIHPADAVTLPPELDPLDRQRLALHGGVCFGLGCSSEDIVIEGLQSLTHRRRGGRIRADRLLCTCLDVFAELGLSLTGPPGERQLAATFDGMEIVDLGPTELENSIECYLTQVIRLGLLPKLQVPLSFSPESGLASLEVEPSPTSELLPHNPALEDDQIKLFLDLEVGPGDGGGGGGGGGGGSSPPVHPGVSRPRTRTGPADATAALSERAVQALFETVRGSVSFSGSGSADFGPFSASYEAEVGLEDGRLEMQSDGTLALRELDVNVRTLEFCVGLDIPELCIGGFCIIPNPFGGCLVRAPRICLFEDDPDLEFCVDLGPFLRSELSGVLRPVVKYARNPSRPPGMDDWQAVEAGHLNHWQLFIDPVTIDVDFLDVADIVGDVLEAAIDAALDTILGPLPDWAKDLIRSLLGPVIDVVREILDLGDDIEEWLGEKLGVGLGFLDFIATAVADHFADDFALVQIREPLTLLPAEPGLIPVITPLEFLGARIEDEELVIEVDLGEP